MAPRERPGDDPLGHFQALLDDPTRHHIFHALRVIETAFPDAPRLGESRRPRQDRMRLGQEPSMAFARTTITSVTPPGGQGPGRLQNLFFGLFGPHGPLPPHLTEYARERQRNARDTTFVAFADMLTHRIMSLLYRAWTTGQPAADLDRGPRGRMARKVAALSGMQGDAFQNRDAMPDMAKRYFTGHLARGPRSAAGLGAMLAAFFRAPVRVQQFVGSWLALEAGDRWQLGAPAGLGQATSIGDRVWSRSAKFRLHIGPLSAAEYQALLPGGDALARLTAIVRGYVGDALDWDVNLVLRAGDVPAASLGGTTRLGQTSWIGTRAPGRDADDLYLEPLRLQSTANAPQRGENDMTEISRVALFGKLNKVGYQAVEGATVFCKMRGNPYVEIVHWLAQILQGQDNDILKIIKHYDLDPARISADMQKALDALPRGATSISDLSAHLEEAMERAWVYGSLLYSSNQVRTGHLLLGLLKTPGLRGGLLNISGEFGKVKPDDLSENFHRITDGSPEDRLSPQDGSTTGGGAEPGEASGARSPAAMGKEEALQQFCTDLTQQARDGKIDPIVGRDEEIRQIVDVLMRRRQNNPILTGEAGVGKTAVVEGFALRIARGDVPPALREARLLVLDVGLLQAGASMKGEFENRLRQVIDEVQASTTPIVMFIDETHTLVGAGGAAGTGDAANLLKPALARGTLRTIGATTWAEYKKHIEKDPALTRRFQVVAVEEPSVEKATLMMRGIASMLEGHHKVQVLDEGIEAAVSLSARYIPARQLPDKSVSVLDTACARVAVSQHAVPAAVDDARRRIESLETELEIIGRDETAGYDAADRKMLISELKASEEARLADLTGKWDAEKAIVADILDLRAKLREGGAPVDAPDAASEEAAQASPMSGAEREALLAQLREKNAELTTLQGEDPLILPIVDAQAVASVVGDWTGIPVGRMVRDEIDTVLNLETHLARRVIGQDHAMKMIAKRIQTSRAGLDNPNKPIGVFLLAGTSGVGKTETALALAEVMYGGEQNVITINMSEYQEAHTVSSLKGAPPGYVGYGEGGVLTEAVRRKPYSVVLLDEVEKAHPDVHEVFFQVFDKGVMEDGEGRVIDFKNTVILLTSNAGSDMIMDMCADPDLMPEPEGISKALRDPLLKIFPAALLGRLVTIPYYPLSPDMIGKITRLQLDRIKKRVEGAHKVPFAYSDDVVNLITERCQELESGGRMIDAIVTNTMLPDISAEFLKRMMQGEAVEKVEIIVENGDFAYRFE